MIAIGPRGVLLLVWLGVWLWDRRPLAGCVVLLPLLALVVTEGTSRVGHAQSMARLATPYDFYEAEVATCIPPGSMVLGFQHYWLGLRQYPYRTWLLPLNFAYPGYYHEPMSLDQAI